MPEKKHKRRFSQCKRVHLEEIAFLTTKSIIVTFNETQTVVIIFWYWYYNFNCRIAIILHDNIYVFFDNYRMRRDIASNNFTVRG